MIDDSEAMLINDKSDITQHFDPAFVIVQHNTTKTRKFNSIIIYYYFIIFKPNDLL